MQQGWGLNDENEWEKFRLLAYFSANHFKKPIKLLDIIKLPSIDTNANSGMESMVEKALAMRERLKSISKGPAK